MTAVCECKKRRGNGKRNKNMNVPDSYSGVSFVMVLAGLCLGIPLIIFVFRVAQDPITPTVLKEATDVVKQRTFGYLSKKTGKVAED
jgi:hypothetical protein